MFSFIYILSFWLSMVLFIWDERTYWGIPAPAIIRITIFSLIPVVNTIMVGWFIFDTYTKYKELKK